MNISLVKEFTHFLFAPDADRFLQNFKNSKDIVSQLNNRRIYTVKFEKLLISSAGLYIESGSFVVVLNDLNTEEDMAISLGHEIGHTFHFDLSVTPPVVICGLSEQNEEEVEKFCDRFSELWLEQADKENVIRRIKNEREMLF